MSSSEVAAMNPFRSDDVDEGSARGVTGIAVGAVAGLTVWAVAFALFRAIVGLFA